MSDHYHVLYRGERLEGVSDTQLRTGLAQLFKASDAVLDKLLSGRPQLLKRDCDRETAERYREAMARIGAIAVLQAVEPAATEPENPARPDSAALDLAAPGTPVLRPEERPGPPAADVQAPDLDLAATGSRLAEEAPAPPAPPDTSHLGLEEPGAPIPQIPGPAPVTVPDSGLTLAPEGFDFSDCHAPAVDPPTLDLSALALAPTGGDLRDAQPPRQDAAKAPSTEHLSLAPEQREA